MIKVNIAILDRRRDDVVEEGDRYYDQFKRWAENEDRKQGVQICEFRHAKKKEAAPPEPAEIEETVSEVGAVEPVAAPKPKKNKHPNFMKQPDIVIELNSYDIFPDEDAKKKDLIKLLLETRKNAEV